MYSEQRKLHGNTEKAVTETIRICKDRNVLREYLMSKEQEVVDIMMTLFVDGKTWQDVIGRGFCLCASVIS